MAEIPIWRTRGNILGEHKRQWRRKVRKEAKRARKIKGFDGWYVILNEDITGKTVKVKKVGTGETFYVAKELLQTAMERG